MAKTDKTEPAAPQMREVPGIRVTTDVNRRVPCAGHFWAGISEVPRHHYSEAQIAELKLCKLLDVNDEITVQVPAEDAPQA